VQGRRAPHVAVRLNPSLGQILDGGGTEPLGALFVSGVGTLGHAAHQGPRPAPRFLEVEDPSID
jgi:hypothetical protein